MSTVESNETRKFRSPPHKLIRFFESSRDKWKQKCMEAKHRCKLLSNQVRAVEKSREHWRAQAEATTRRLEEVEQLLRAEKRELLSR